MQPGGELQKTCPLSPSNSKIWAADLKNTQEQGKYVNCKLLVKTSHSRLFKIILHEIHVGAEAHFQQDPALQIL